MRKASSIPVADSRQLAVGVCLLLSAVCLSLFGCRDGREDSPLPKEVSARQLPSKASEGSRGAASNALVRKALDASKRGKSDEAKGWLESALSFDPTNPYPPHLLGLLALESGDQREAEALFQKAFVQYDTHNEWALECALLLGVAAERQKHWATAQDAYRAAVTIAPENSRAQQGLESVSRRLESSNSQ